MRIEPWLKKKKKSSCEELWPGTCGLCLSLSSLFSEFGDLSQFAFYLQDIESSNGNQSTVADGTGGQQGLRSTGGSGCNFTKSLWKYIKKRVQRSLELSPAATETLQVFMSMATSTAFNMSQVAAFYILTRSHKAIQLKDVLGPSSNPLWLCGGQEFISEKKHRVL